MSSARQQPSLKRIRRNKHGEQQPDTEHADVSQHTGDTTVNSSGAAAPSLTVTSNDIAVQPYPSQDTQWPTLPPNITRIFPLGLPTLVCFIYMTALTLCEIVITFIDVQLGLLLHSTLLVALVIAVGRWWGQPIHRLALCLLFGPLIRILSFSLPLVGFPLIYWFFATSIPLFIATIMLINLLNLSWTRTVGMNIGRGPPLQALTIQLAIGLGGLVLGYTEYVILRPESLSDTLVWNQMWFPILVLFVSTGYFEELVFRGVMQEVVKEFLGSWGSIFVVSYIFAALHIGYQSLPDLIFVFVAGFFFGWAFDKTGSLLGVTIAHALTNIMLFVVLPHFPQVNVLLYL